MSNVIKSEEFDELASRTELFSLKDIEEEAAQILSSARDRAMAILERAMAEGKRARSQAFDEGFREGRAKGEAEGRVEGHESAREEALRTFGERCDELVEALRNALTTFNENRNRYLAKAESDLVDLMLAVSRRVVKRIGMVDRQVAIENLKGVIEQVGHRSDLVIRVSPAEVESINMFAKELADAEQGWAHVKVVADEGISPGGCVVGLGEGEVDATLESQLDHVAALLVPGRVNSR